jgi:hypothetical protein
LAQGGERERREREERKREKGHVSNQFFSKFQKET